MVVKKDDLLRRAKPLKKRKKEIGLGASSGPQLIHFCNLNVPKIGLLAAFLGAWSFGDCG